ncbi:chromosome partitioning protein [Micromonospora musae]|uniref:Chromosome partitioning protein n=1 Tax=Micromonospora musae TaxID=1894970 RepID=A0A3A9XTX1_9ACTN|nr:chromosome partitioning protein [Micromonospora musae]
MDDNADRVRVPGQQPVPERDIEPPWPSDPTEATAAPWATVGAPTSADVTAARPDAPTADPLPGQPTSHTPTGADTAQPIAGADAYPSLTSALPPHNGWAPPGVAWAPAQPGRQPTAADPQVAGTAATRDSAGGSTPGTAGSAGDGDRSGDSPPQPGDRLGEGQLAAAGRSNGSTAGPHAALHPPAAKLSPTAGPAATNGVPAAAEHPQLPGTGTASGRSTGAPAASSGSTAGAAASDDGHGTGAAAARGPGGGRAAAGGVDLNLPFSLDPAPGLGNGRAVVDQPSGPPGAAQPSPAAGMARPSPSDGAAQLSAGTAQPPTGAAQPSDGTAQPSDGTAQPSATAQPSGGAAGGGAGTDVATRTPGTGGSASTDEGHRPPGTPNGSAGSGRAGESPWAYPPQRVSAETEPNGSTTAPAAPAVPAAAGPAGTNDDPTAAGGPGASPNSADPAWSDVEEVEPTSGDTPAPPGPFPPDWQPRQWQQDTAGVAAQPYQPQPAGPAPTPAGYPSAGPTPTAEDFARRRQVRPADPLATMGVRAVVNKIGLRLPPGRHEQELKRDIETVRRNFGGLRQVTVVNPKGGAGKTVAILLLAMTFGQKRGGYVLAWDNNETQGTLGMRAQQDFHSRTVRDLLRDLGQFQAAHGRVGDLSQYVRSQGEGMFDVLASDESATGGEMLTASAFAELREVVSRFYKLIFVDTGNNVRAQNWQAAMDATDQLLVTMSARNDSAETAARMLDHLEQSGRQRLVRQAVTVVSMPPSRKDIDLPAIQAHFAARTRSVLLAPYERLIDSGEPIRYAGLSTATRDAWLKIAAAVAEGL